MLNINKTVNDSSAVIALEGRLDTVTAPELEKELQALLPGLTELKLDFAKLDYISSAGLRVLLCVYLYLLRDLKAIVNLIGYDLGLGRRRVGVVVVTAASGKYCCCHCAAKDGCKRHQNLFHCY